MRFLGDAAVHAMASRRAIAGPISFLLTFIGNLSLLRLLIRLVLGLSTGPLRLAIFRLASPELPMADDSLNPGSTIRNDFLFIV